MTTQDNIFNQCAEINELIERKQDEDARKNLIKLLDQLKRSSIEYSPLINHLIRRTGLFPYMTPNNAIWQDVYVYNIFKVDIGEQEEKTLHIEQSGVLKKLLDGKNLAISAPTSFGKSFIIDAFIAIKKPNNIVIIVPTLALTDEIRRRLYKKFSDEYQIITTSNIPLQEKNIFIFPQERALHYANKITEIDLLVIDEFYKASREHDKDRSPALLKTILKLKKKAKQHYYLAPNISTLKDNIFTEGMEFEEIKFSTVFLNIENRYEQIEKEAGKEEKIKRKEKELIDILHKSNGNTLIYAGTYKEIDNVTKALLSQASQKSLPSKLQQSFCCWLKSNYGQNWDLPKLVSLGIGIHNGRLHRSLTQIQIKLFEEPQGLKTIISTSSIIEGVNTSAENIILWCNKKGGQGNPHLDILSYKNIIGRAGRMFKHFIGNVYLLSTPI